MTDTDSESEADFPSIDEDEEFSADPFDDACDAVGDEDEELDTLDDSDGSSGDGDDPFELGGVKLRHRDSTNQQYVRLEDPIEE